MAANAPQAAREEVEEGSSSEPKNGSLLAKENGSDLESQPEATSRGVWSSRLDFILSCVGFAVGLGNIWRFPYLCYKNGGGAFLVPYAIFALIGGIPVFFLELSIGQFMGQAGMRAWNICPLFKGIGLDTTVIVFLMNCYYIIILAWNGVYLADSFAALLPGSQGLPWNSCGNWGNSSKCMMANVTVCYNETNTWVNETWKASSNASVLNAGPGGGWSDCTTRQFQVNAAEEYFKSKVLQISDGIDQVGGIVWELAVSLLAMWIVSYFCIWKGVKWTGKIVYFTAVFPYIIITMLLIRGVTLPGAHAGIVFYLKPDFKRLADITVWLDAGTQVFFSFAVAIGAHITLGSFNKFKYNCLKDAMIVAGVDMCTSFYAGFAIFSVLGFMAHEQNVPIENVTSSGPGLVFVAYPTAISQMPVAQPVWAIGFFIMIVFVGLDSQFVAVESFVTCIMDMFSDQLAKYRYANRETIAACYCAVSYLVGLTMVTNGGMYVFQLFDYYSASGISLLWVAFWECCAIAWVYGINSYCDQLSIMLGFKVNFWFKLCWCGITPLVIMGLFVSQWVLFELLKYGDSYVYPIWAQGLGLCLALSSMVCVPAYAIYAMATTKGTLKQRWKKLTSPVLSSRQTTICDTDFKTTRNLLEYHEG